MNKIKEHKQPFIRWHGITFTRCIWCNLFYKCYVIYNFTEKSICLNKYSSIICISFSHLNRQQYQHQHQHQQHQLNDMHTQAHIESLRLASPHPEEECGNLEYSVLSQLNKFGWFCWLCLETFPFHPIRWYLSSTKIFAMKTLLYNLSWFHIMIWIYLPSGRYLCIRFPFFFFWFYELCWLYALAAYISLCLLFLMPYRHFYRLIFFKIC